jgi:hypothetical protein
MAAQKCCVCEPIAQRTCRICREPFEVVRRPGRPRSFCWVCEPVGFQLVKVPGQSRVKLRRRPSQLRRMTVVRKSAA